jgi:hypothetical protein
VRQRLLRGAFGHADERPYRRLTSDLVKLPLAVVLVAVSALRVGNESVVETRFEQFFRSLPDNVHPFFDVGWLR